MKKLNIAFVIGHLKYSGAEKVLSILIDQFVKKGIDVTIVLTGKNEVSEGVKKEKVKIFSAYVEGNVVKRKLNRISRLYNIFKKGDFDIIVGFGNVNAIPAIPAARMNNIPIIVCERNDPKVDPPKWINRVERKILYFFANGFVFQTDQARDFFFKNKNSNSIVIPNPLDCDNLPVKLSIQPKKEIVSVGRLDNNQKNHILLIRAFNELLDSHPEYILNIFGEGPDRKLIENEVKSLNLEGKVNLPGRVDNPMDIIRDAELFVLSSNFEGMPNALIEAMAIGIPTISTNCPIGGPEFLINNNVNGLLVPVNDKQALVKAMNLLITNRELRDSIAIKSQEIKSILNPDSISNQWINYFFSFING